MTEEIRKPTPDEYSLSLQKKPLPKGEEKEEGHFYSISFPEIPLTISLLRFGQSTGRILLNGVVTYSFMFGKNKEIKHIEGVIPVLQEKLHIALIEYDVLTLSNSLVKKFKMLEIGSPHPEQEINRIENNEPRFKFFEDFGEPSPPGWLVKDLLPDRGTVIWAGPAGNGKSMVIQSIIYDLLNNNSILGHFKANNSSCVILIDRENSHPVLYDRFIRLGGVPKQKLLMLHFEDPFDLDTDFSTLHEMVEKTKPDLVVIDTLRRSHSRDENKAEEMNDLYIKAIKPIEQKTCVIVVAHTRKPSFGKQVEDLMDIRGSTDITGMAAAVFVVTKQNRTNLRFVKCVKMRQAKEPEKFSVKIIGEEGEPLKVLYDKEIAETKKEGSEQAQKLIKEYCEIHNPSSEWNTSDLIDYCFGQGISKRSAERAISSLVSQEYFIRNKKGKVKQGKNFPKIKE